MKTKRMTKRQRKEAFGYGVMSPLDRVGVDKFGQRIVIHAKGVITHRAGRPGIPKRTKLKGWQKQARR